LLYVNSGGVECYNVSDLSHPDLLNWLSQPLIYDFFVVDTLLYTSSRDSFRIFSVANPASPRWLGACADSGFVMYVSGNYAYLGHQAGLFILDVSNPTSPRRITGLGFDVQSIWVSDTLLYFGTYDSTFRVYNVKNPTSPIPVGSLAGIAPTCLYQSQTCDTVIYSPGFNVISLANPATPRLVGSVSLPGWEYGVSVVPALNCALVANYYEGLVAVDIRNPSVPVMDTQQYAADLASDICIQGNLAFVADRLAGMRVLDIGDPTSPVTLGGIDSVFAGVLCPSVAVRDSFAFMGMYRPWFRSIDVSNPARPTMAGACNVPTEPQDMVVRDSFVYAAINYEFDIVNVARPRAPVVVGTCGLPDMTFGLYIWDTLAYIANSYSLNILNIAQPANPHVVGTLSAYPNAMDRRDTFMLVVSDFWLVSYSVADPVQPHELDSVRLTGHMHDVLVLDSIAYCGGWVMQMVDIADPQNMRVLPGAWLPPSLYMHRLRYAQPYIYAACTDGGVAILETLQTGVSELPSPKSPLRVWLEPTVTQGRIRFRLDSRLARFGPVSVYDAGGAKLPTPIAVRDGRSGEIDLSNAPDGVYLLRVAIDRGSYSAKVVKTTRR